MVIFNGVNISEQKTPSLLRWLPKLSIIRWGFEGLAINEFQGLSFVSPPGMPSAIAARVAASHADGDEAAHSDEAVQGNEANKGAPFAWTGDEALGRVSLKGRPLRGAVAAQARLVSGFYVGTFAVLQSQRPTFARMAPPASRRALF